jgi:hypothetical protein
METSTNSSVYRRRPALTRLWRMPVGSFGAKKFIVVEGAILLDFVCRRGIWVV